MRRSNRSQKAQTSLLLREASCRRAVEQKQLVLLGRVARLEEPRDLGSPVRANRMLKKFHQDLARLGIRARRQHDLRRTFISLCLGDGGRSDILRWVTHSRPRTATIDDYTTLVWNPLCEEVAKLRITLRGRGGDAISAIANLANSRALADDRATGFATGSEFEKDFEILNLRGGRDLKVRPPVGQDRTAPDSDGHGAENRGLATDENGPGRTGADSDCKSVSAQVAPGSRSSARRTAGSFPNRSSEHPP